MTNTTFRMRVLGIMAVSALTALASADALPLDDTRADESDLAAFREARFGMFIHWGLYSQLGGRWKGEKMKYIGEWIQSRYQIPNVEYAKLAKDFNPVKFNADEWVRQAKDAGMEYLVFTTKHHDGFSMYATKVSDYNIVDATPFKRDVFGELVAACRRHGLKVGLYYSQNMDWHEFDAADPRVNVSGGRTALANNGMSWGNSWDWPDDSKKDFDRYLKEKVYPQLKELLTNYGEIFVIWFDCPIGMTVKQSQDLKNYVRSIQPHVLVSGRIGNGFGDFDTPGDNQLLAGKSSALLECPITLNDTWGFKYDDHNWKSAYRVACDLAATISGNANLLLNVGPRPDGRFPDASSDVMHELSAWRKRTGIRIKGATGSPFAQEMPWGWCTVADGNVLQFVVRSDWTDDLEIYGIRNKIIACTAAYETNADRLKVHLPKPDDAMPRVVLVTLDGVPDVDGRLVPQQGELVLLPSASCRVVQGAAKGSGREGDLIGKDCRITGRGALTDWHHVGDAIVWKAYFPEPGEYAVLLRTETWWHGRKWEGDRKVKVSVGDDHVVSEIRKDRPLPFTVYERAETEAGVVRVSGAGEREITVMTISAGPNAAYQDLTQVRLVERRSTGDSKAESASSML